MKYLKFMEKIMRELAAYKADVDKLAGEYVAEKEKCEARLESMKGKYTESYISENRKHWEPSVDYGKIIDLARETHKKAAMGYFDKIKSELDGYFQVPVDSGFVAVVTGAKNLGVTLSNREFELLQATSGGYWGLRLLNELAISRNKTRQETELGNGEMKRREKETKMPYGGVRLPDIEKVYDGLQDVKNAINIAFEGYCGEGYELKDIVFPLSKTAEETNAKLTDTYGIKTQPQVRGSVEIARMASSIKCFDENHSTYTAFSEMMESLAATMPRQKRKETLTDDDKKLIDTLIDSRYESLAKDQAVRIAKADEHLAEILMLDTRYGATVKTALEEVNGNE